MLQLAQNKLLHRIRELSHPQKESSVREIKSAETHLHSYCFSVSLSSCIRQLLN